MGGLKKGMMEDVVRRRKSSRDKNFGKNLS
jgi:hypothetical protein